ncbi:hypothetical protein GQF01_03215 [Paenibacillus sp. 5J-6]|uniref:Heparinase n=2 Tax=Paenibacillus silvestris TaxID=2606219 RepID=A0A6L8UTC3_9BACL|nr:hypothetical protein [Paenibacillus silvestris]
MADQLELWKEMMSNCCREIVTLREDIIADFSIKEIMFSLRIMKETITIPVEWEQEWFRWLQELDPYLHYGSVIRDHNKATKLHNINIYNMVGEFLRESVGLTDASAYFAKHWPTQLQHFDEKGMYMDPGCPILYDLTTRCQIQLMLGFGYQGEFAAELDRMLCKAGEATLLMQSASFEFPYGGRSNQFLFNETLIAANAEYESVRYERLGDLLKASKFRRCARLAIESIERWMRLNPPRHIKNMYSIQSKHGTESYGFYDKYMISMGAFLAIAYWFTEDESVESDNLCPAEHGGYVWQTEESFHKVFANSNGYSIEIDYSADLSYDATGLGRLHRRGAPTELGLSTPLSAGESFSLSEGVERIHAVIGPGWVKPEGTFQYLAECGGLDVQCTVHEESKQSVRFSVTYRGAALQGCEAVLEHYELDASGLKLHVELLGALHDEVHVQIPVLITNGEETTDFRIQGSELRVKLNGYEYRARCEGIMSISEQVYGNRNGEYKLARAIVKEKATTIYLQLEKV